MFSAHRQLAALVATASFVVTTFAAAPVRAEPSGDAAAAANAYQEAQKAELSRDHLRAAEMFELADSMVPSPEALRAAIRNYDLAGRKDLAASLAWALRRRYEDEESRELADELLDKYSAELLSVEVTCDSPCTISSEGKAVSHLPETEHRVFLEPGEHGLELVFGKDLQVEETVAGGAGDIVTISAERPPDPEPEVNADGGGVDVDLDPGANRKRLSPAWFVVGAVATAGLGGALAWSGTEVLSINDEYEAEPTQQRLDDGQSAELRTNIFIGATAVAGVATVALAVFTDWGRWKRSNEAASRPSITPWVGIETRSLGVGGRF